MKRNEPLSMQEKYIRGVKRHKMSVRVLRVLLLILFLAIWELTTIAGILDSFIFSSPTRIVITFIDMVKDGSMFRHIGVTLGETLVSFFLVCFFGVTAAVLLWMSKKLAEVLEPYLVVLNSLPKSALAPLLIVWLGASFKTIVVAGMSVAIFGTIINLYTGFQEVDEEKIKLIRTLGGKKKDALFKVVLPGSIPILISTMKVNIGLALVGVIIGEFLAAREGLGYLIIYGSQVFN